MHISEVARATGLTPRAIRLYEAKGIISGAPRGEGGYRTFDRDDLATLRFVRYARELGFDLPSIGRLVQMWRTGSPREAELRQLLAEHVVALRRSERALRERRRRTESLLAGGCPRPFRPRATKTN